MAVAGRTDLRTKYPNFSRFVQAVSFQDCTDAFSTFEGILNLGLRSEGGLVRQVFDLDTVQMEAAAFEADFPATAFDRRQEAFWALGACEASREHIERVLTGLRALSLN